MAAFDGVVGDGVTDDTQAFLDYRVNRPNDEVNLGRKCYKVTDFPPGPFTRGWFVKSNNTPVTPIDIHYPAPGTIISDTMLLTDGSRYAGWGQGKGAVYRNGIHFGWNEGSDHQAADLHVRSAVSTDGGTSFRRFERLFQSKACQTTAWARGICDGQDFWVVRENEVATAQRLYGRAMTETRQVTCEIKTTAGTGALQVFIGDHGRRSGNKFKLPQAMTIDGITIPAGIEYAITNGTPSRFYTNITGQVASVGITETRTFVIDFLCSAPAEIKPGGVSLGEAILAYGLHTSLPDMIHSISCDSASGGTIYLGCHGGGTTPCVIKITGALGNSPTINKIRQIHPTMFRTEPNVRKRASDGLVVAMSRTQGATNSPALAFSRDDCETFTTFSNGPRETFQYSNFDFFFLGPYLIAYATGNRTGVPDVAGNYAQAYVPSYVLVGKVDELEANGWPAFKVYSIGPLLHYNEITGREVNVVGVGAIVPFGNTLVIFTSQDTYDDAAGVTSDGDCYVTRIPLGCFIEEYRETQDSAQGHNAIGKARGGVPAADIGYFETVVGSNSAKAICLFSGSGTKLRGFGMRASRTAPFKYTIHIDEPKQVPAYFPIVQAIGKGASAEVIDISNPALFLVETSSTTTEEPTFVVLLFMLEDFTRTGWI